MDAGNSRLKWSWLKNGEIDHVFSEAYSVEGKSQLVEKVLQEAEPARLLMVHVLGIDFENTVKKYCRTMSVKCQFVHSTRSCCGLINGYEIPAQLGADRFVALIGTRHLYPQQDCIVIDAGTALTVDAVTKSGKHLGGLIVPGLQLSSDSLIKNTQLQHTSVKTNPEMFATNTSEGIASGGLYGLLGAIEYVCAAMQSKMHKDVHTGAVPLKRLICGGDSQILATHLQRKYPQEGNLQTRYEWVPDLVMHGLLNIENNNNKI